MFVDELPSDVDNRPGLASLARTLLDEISRTFYVNQQEVYLTASVGIAICPFDAENVIDLIRNADAAMYHSKQNGGNTWAFYIPQMNAAAVERLMLKSKLRRALERDELVILYQSKVDLRDGRVVGAEALLRWRLPGHGDISPSQFIPLAEETSLILDIGEWVLNRVCADYRGWQRTVRQPGRIAINLSLRQLKQASFISRCRNVFGKHGVSPSSFELEVTETTLMTDPKRTIGLLNELYAMGLHLAIDDFGTGYSSLSALQQFPIGTLKIDQSFVRDLSVDSNRAALVRTIIDMGKSLDLEVIAEGVETAEQLEFLRAHGCFYAQGRLFGDAMEADKLLGILADQVGGPAHHAAICASPSGVRRNCPTDVVGPGSDSAPRRGAAVRAGRISPSSAAIRSGSRAPMGPASRACSPLCWGNWGRTRAKSTFRSALKIAHVEQEIGGIDRPAIEYVLDGDAELRRVMAAIEDAERRDAAMELAELYAALQAIDGYRARARAAAIMHGLGFKPDEHERKVGEFSGGWRVRLSMARALNSRADLLLLDEPTNHLDLDAIFWLEEWLASTPTTLLVVSHDREFLDAVIGRVLHIENKTIRAYSGNYSQFEQKRAEELALQQAFSARQARRVAQITSFVVRFRAKASKARQAQSRLKMLEKMERIVPAHVDSPFEFEFAPPLKTPRPLLTVEDAACGYEGRIILEGIDVSIGPHGSNRAARPERRRKIHADQDARRGGGAAFGPAHAGGRSRHRLFRAAADGTAASRLRGVLAHAPMGRPGLRRRR